MRYKKEEPSVLDKINLAMKEFLKQDKYETISSSDIIRKAKVSRSTFYIYFKSKEQVLDYLVDNMLNEVFVNPKPGKKASKIEISSEEKLKGIIYNSYAYFRKEKSLILPILNTSASQTFLKQLRKRLKPVIIDFVDHHILGQNDIPLDIKCHQYVNGYVALLQYYLRHADDLDSKIIGDYYFTFCR